MGSERPGGSSGGQAATLALSLRTRWWGPSPGGNRHCRGLRALGRTAGPQAL